jgi:ubiquitin C-terminal hydrolase
MGPKKIGKREMTPEQRREYERERKKLQRQNAKNRSSNKVPVAGVKRTRVGESTQYESPWKRIVKEDGESTDTRTVVGLENRGGNVCFGNVVVQLLRPLDQFGVHLRNASSVNSCVHNLQQLFRRMNESTGDVRGAQYFHGMNIPGYVINQQYDAQEFLGYLLREVYHGVDNTVCMFNIGTTSSVTCGRTACRHATTPVTVDATMLTLKVSADGSAQSLSGLLREYVKPEYLHGYKCGGCQSVGSCTKTVTLGNCPSALLMHLVIFDCMGRKIKPSLLIERDLTDFGLSVEICGVVYHLGNSINEGHYTCSVKVDGVWYYMNDCVVTREPPTLCSSLNGRCVPYIVMYRKKQLAVGGGGPCCSADTSCKPSKLIPAEKVIKRSSTDVACGSKRVHEMRGENIESQFVKKGKVDSKDAVNVKAKARMATVRLNQSDDQIQLEKEKAKGIVDYSLFVV